MGISPDSNYSKVIHPFYVFQIASIILWSLDDYYYYAFCIALISVASVTSTLIETRKVSFFAYAMKFLFLTQLYSDDCTYARNVPFLLPHQPLQGRNL